MTVEERVVQMKSMIELAGTACGLNLTIYEGKLAFVDQEQMKIVALWEPTYSAATNVRSE